MEADFFYIPLLFPLFFWMETPKLLQCVNSTLHGLEYTQMGYNVLINYGHEYPHWKAFPELTMDNYHPFAPNFHIITVALLKQGRKNELFNGMLFKLQRLSLIPYFTTYKCFEERDVSRPFDVCFAGSIKRDGVFGFRERVYFCDAYEKRRWPNVFLQPIDPGDDQRSQFAKLVEWRSELYSKCRYCAVMPGDGNTAQRAFDAMTQHCVPVFLYHPDALLCFFRFF